MVSKDHCFLTENFHPLNRFFWCVSVFLTFILLSFWIKGGGGGGEWKETRCCVTIVIFHRMSTESMFSILVYICFFSLKRRRVFQADPLSLNYCLFLLDRKTVGHWLAKISFILSKWGYLRIRNFYAQHFLKPLNTESWRVQGHTGWLGSVPKKPSDPVSHGFVAKT